MSVKKQATIHEITIIINEIKEQVKINDKSEQHFSVVMYI